VEHLAEGLRADARFPGSGARLSAVRARTAIIAVVLMVALAVSACGGDAGPRRILLVGDSVMNQTAGPLAHDLPDDDVRNESVFGSGLLTAGYVDWPAQLGRLLDHYRPDVVVFLFVGNYEFSDDESDLYTTADGHRIETRTDPAFFRAWQAQAQRMTDAASEVADDVIWVLPPPMQFEEADTVADGLRIGYEHLDTTTVDAADVLADDEGNYLASDGDTLLRSDGVHLTPEGARRLAQLIADQLD